MNNPVLDSLTLFYIMGALVAIAAGVALLVMKRDYDDDKSRKKN